MRHALTLAQEAGIKLKKCEGLSNDPSVMQISAVLHSEVLAVQGQSGQPGSTQNINQIQDLTIYVPNWKTNLTCYKCEEKGHLT